MGILAAITGPALPYVAGGVAVALALGAWQINDRAYDRGYDKGVAAERKTWQPTLAVLNRQNAAIAELKRQRDDARARVKTGLERAAEREATLAPLIDALNEEGRSTAPVRACVVTPGNVAGAERLL